MGWLWRWTDFARAICREIGRFLIVTIFLTLLEELTTPCDVHICGFNGQQFFDIVDSRFKR